MLKCSTTNTLRVVMLIVLGFIFCLGMSGVSAQGSASSDNPLRLGVSPAITNLVTAPGTAVTATITITNQNQIPEEVRLNIKKFNGYTDGGLLELADRESGDNYFDWISLSADRLLLDAKESKTITAIINVPQDASFGYYYAVTLARDDKNTIPSERPPASLIFLEANAPNVKHEVELVDFSTDQEVYEYLPVSFHIKVRNTGNVHTMPIGTVSITSATTGEPIVLLVNSVSNSMLPSTSRVFNIKWEDGFPMYVDKTINGKAARELRWDFDQLEKFRFGKYDARLLLTYHDGTRDQVIEKTTSFWVIPWKILATAALLGALMLAGAYSIARSIITPRRSK